MQSPSNCIWSLSERIKHCWVLHAMLGTQLLLGQSDTSQTNENLKKIEWKLKLRPWVCPQWARTKQWAATKGNKRGVGFLHAVCLNKPLLQGYCEVELSFQKAFVRVPKPWYQGFWEEMKGSLLQGNGIDRMGLGWVGAGGRFLLPVQGTQPGAGLQSVIWVVHTLWSGPTTGSSGFRHFDPRNHLMWWFFPFYPTSWFCDHRGFLFPFTHPFFELNKSGDWSSFSPQCLFSLRNPFAAWIPIQAPHLWHVEIFTFLVTERFKIP